MTTAEDGAQCRAAGMDGCLHKPLTMNRLRAVLERLFPGWVQVGGWRRVAQIVENFTEPKPYSTPW